MCVCMQELVYQAVGCQSLVEMERWHQMESSPTTLSSANSETSEMVIEHIHDVTTVCDMNRWQIVCTMTSGDIVKVGNGGL